ncbi:hypothetical protein Q5M85_11225 [Paraclostridium bifermentans]|nr:hypothetical protein [Paraclostridium bifermentans]
MCKRLNCRIKPNDYDITTNAKPNTISIFKNYKIIETGIKHGFQ